MGDKTKETYEISGATNRPRGAIVSVPVSSDEIIELFSYSMVT